LLFEEGGRRKEISFSGKEDIITIKPDIVSGF